MVGKVGPSAGEVALLCLGHGLLPQGWRLCLVPPGFPLLRCNKAYRFYFSKLCVLF